MAMSDFGPQQAQMHDSSIGGGSSMECLGGGVLQDKIKGQHLSTDSIKNEDGETATSKRRKSKSVLCMYWCRCFTTCIFGLVVTAGSYCTT